MPSGYHTGKHSSKAFWQEVFLQPPCLSHPSIWAPLFSHQLQDAGRGSIYPRGAHVMLQPFLLLSSWHYLHPLSARWNDAGFCRVSPFLRLHTLSWESYTSPSPKWFMHRKGRLFKGPAVVRPPTWGLPLSGKLVSKHQQQILLVPSVCLQMATFTTQWHSYLVLFSWDRNLKGHSQHIPGNAESQLPWLLRLRTV